MIQRTVSSRVVIILDCCYSGSATLSKGREDDKARIGTAAIDRGTRIFQGEGRCILAASQALQEAYSSEEENHSLFTFYVLKGLQGKDREALDKHGDVTVDTLSRYVYQKIMDLPPEKSPKQKPFRKIETSGDIILVERPYLPKLKPYRLTLKSEAELQTRKGSLGKRSMSPQKLTQFELETKLKKLCKDILDGYYENESEVRSEFTHLIKNYLNDNPDLLGIKLREDVRIIEGKPDARIGKLIIEFESPITSNKTIRKFVSEKYITKTKVYLKNLKLEGHVTRAIVTNGIEIVFLDEEGDIIERGILCET
jgi:hypothetical protein